MQQTVVKDAWGAAIESYQGELVSRHVSPNTLRAYAGDLGELADWAHASGIDDPASLRYRQLRGYAAALGGRGLKRSSVGRKLAAARGLFEYLTRTGVSSQNPAELLPNPRSESRLPRVLDRDEIRELLDGSPAGTPLEVRDRAMLELAYSSGLRCAELVGLDADAIDRSGSRPSARSPSICGGLARRWSPSAPSAPCSSPRAAGGSPPQTSRGASRWRCAAPRSLGASPRTRCATPSPPTCWRGAPTCARSRSCSVIRASRPPRSTRALSPRGCVRRTPARTRGRDDVPGAILPGLT
jgi:hypothetical protein